MIACEILPVGIHFNVPREVYDAQVAVNQSTIKKFASAKTPAHFRYQVDHPPEKEKDYLRLGTALDTLVGSPIQYKERYVTAPASYPSKEGDKPWNWNANYCKSWRDKMHSAGLEVITDDERACIHGMLSGLEANEDVVSILTNTERHVVLIAEHPIFGCRLKAEVDLWPKTHSAALGQWYFELKTSGVGADDLSFHEHCYDMGYVKQIAFYLMVARLVGFTDMHSCGIIAVESDAPWMAKIHYAHWDDPEVAKERMWFDEWIPKYLACVRENQWPGYQHDWSRIRYRKPWMLRSYEEIQDALT